MDNPMVLRLLEIKQELQDLQGVSKPTPAVLQRLQALAQELKCLQTGPPPPPPVPLPAPPPPPVFSAYGNVIPQYGGLPPVPAGPVCGGCGNCGSCITATLCDIPGNPVPIVMFQGPHGCAPAYTLQGPPGLIGPPGPTGPPGGGDVIFDLVCEKQVLLFEPPDPSQDYIILHTDGPLTRDVPADTVEGGICRGMYSVDFQALRSDKVQVAHGTGTVVLGGVNNEADAYFGEVVGGNGNLVADTFWENTVDAYAQFGIAYNPLLPFNWDFSVNNLLGTGTNPLLPPSAFEPSISTLLVSAGVPGGAVVGGMNNSVYPGQLQLDPELMLDPVYFSQNLVGMGINNSITGAYSTINNGIQNTISSTATALYVTSGRGDGVIYEAVGANNVIENGFLNSMYNSGVSSIVNGALNSMTGAMYSQILNGYNNSIYISDQAVFIPFHNTIINGEGNRIFDSEGCILGGLLNSMTGCNYSYVGGYSNEMTGTVYSVILGGSSNRIDNLAGAATVGGEGLSLSTRANSCAVGEYNDDVLAITAASYFYQDDVTEQIATGTYTYDQSQPRLFMVGNGDLLLGRSNAFSVTKDGYAHVQYGYTSGGADYAEYFEAAQADVPTLPLGMPVVINPDTGLIRAATASDTQFLGVVRSKRALTSIVGNTYDTHWHGMYLKNEHGDIVYETVTTVRTGPGDYIPVKSGSLLKQTVYVQGPPKVYTGTAVVPVLNPEYDPTKTYVPRIARPEWHVVGLLGQVLILKNKPVSPKWIKLKSYNTLYDTWFISP